MSSRRRIKIETRSGFEIAELKFDCPWTGHLYDDRLVIRNSAAPHVIGHRCIKCGCLVYEVMEQSQIVGPGGEPLPKA